MGRAGKVMFMAALCVVCFTWPGTAQKQDRTERKIVTRVAPVYPDLAKRMHVSGVVKVQVVVRDNGNVKSIKVMGGNPVLIESATDAIRKWKFEAAAAETTETLQLTFEPQ